MRRDNDNWNPPDPDATVVTSDVLTVTQIYPERQVLISGVNARAASNLTLVGWPGDVIGDRYALVLRRDRVMEVNADQRADGWDNTTQCAVSDVTDGYAVFEIQGTGALALLKQGGFINAEQPSPSVARQMFGQPVLLYRTNPQSYRLHVNSMYTQTLRDHIKSRATSN
jgi:glycine cleavage system aminomethyltransferase T